jgi:hypothetical protein
LYLLDLDLLVKLGQPYQLLVLSSHQNHHLNQFSKSVIQEIQELLSSKILSFPQLVQSQEQSSLNGTFVTLKENKVLQECGIPTSESEDQKVLNLEQLNVTKTSTVLHPLAMQHSYSFI